MFADDESKVEVNNHTRKLTDRTVSIKSAKILHCLISRTIDHEFNVKIAKSSFWKDRLGL